MKTDKIHLLIHSKFDGVGGCSRAQVVHARLQTRLQSMQHRNVEMCTCSTCSRRSDEMQGNAHPPQDRLPQLRVPVCVVSPRSKHMDHSKAQSRQLPGLLTFQA